MGDGTNGDGDRPGAGGEAPPPAPEDGAERGDTAEAGKPGGRERRPGGRKRRTGGRKRRALARLLGLLCLALAFLIFHVTQTRTGREAVLSLIRGQLEGLVEGRVRIGPVLRGNLLTRVVLERFEISGPDGAGFVTLDTVRLEYDPLTFLRGDFRFRGLDAARARVRLAQARDGTWNFERLFRGGRRAPPGEPVVADTAAAGGALLSFADARVRGGEVEIRTPWEPEAGPGAEAEAEESIWNLERTGEGAWDRVYRLESASGSFPLIRILDPRRPFRVEMRELSGILAAVRQPLRVSRFDGAATFGDTVRVAVDRFETPSSSLSGSGWVVPGEPLAYAFELAADPASFEDLQWLPVPVPSSGGGPMRIDLRSRGETVVVEVSDGDARSDDTRVTGGFTLALEEPARFESLDLRFDPLRLRWLDRLLDRPETVDGYVRGRVTGAGRIDALRIDAQVTLADVEGGAAPSRVVARGGVSLVEPYPLRDLSLELEEAEPRWMGVLGFSPGLEGRVSGTATLDRPPGGPLAFEGDLRHRGPEGRASRIYGSGALDLERGSTVRLDLVADPLALSAVRPFAPDLDLVGSVRGPVRASGSVGDLQASADLETPRGRLRFDGRFDLEAEEPRYDAEVTASGIELDQWLEGAPTSRLAVRGRVTGQGTDPATLSATLDLELLPSQLDRVRIDTSVVHVELAEGVARVDTLDIRSDIGTLGGQGRFGLVEGREEALAFEARIPELSDLDRWILDEIPGGAAVEGDEEDLFADFEAAIAAPEARVDGLAGSLVARGVLFGNLERFTVEAFLDASAPRYQAFGADTLSARVNLQLPGLDSLAAQVTLVDLDLAGQPVDSLSARLERTGEGPASVRLHARRDTTLELVVEGDVEWEDAYAADLARLRLMVGGAEASLDEPSRIVYSDSGLVVHEFLLAGELGALAVDGVIPSDRPGRLELRLRDVDLARIARAVPELPELGGRVTGSLNVTGTMDAPRMAGELGIADPTLRTARYESLEGTFEYADRAVRIDVSLAGATGRLARIDGTIRADLSLRSVERRLLEQPLDLRVAADSLPLTLLELRVRSLEEIGGHAEGSITLRGEPGELRYGGSMRIVDGTAWVPDLGVRFHDVTGAASFSGSEAVVDSLRIASELGGTAALRGTVDVSTLSDPALDLELRARRLRPIDRRDMRVAIDGEGHLGGRYRAPELTGDFRILEGDLRQEEFLRARQVVDLSDPTIYGLLDTAFVQDRRLLERFQNPFMQNLRVDATVDLGPNLWLRSDVLNVEMVATDLSVEMDRALDRTVVVGTVELPRGTYRFDRVRPYSQQLRITGGEIQFVGNPDLNPNLSITAEYRTRTQEGPVVVAVHIGGTMNEPQLTLSSNPPMSDSDQVCFLAVGAPCVGAADERLAQRLAQESILGTLSSGLSSALVGSTGLSYFNLRTYGGAPSGGAGVQGSQGLFSSTAIELGWYAGEEVFLTLSQPLGGGIPRATVEWRFTDNWTLEGRAESRFEQQQYGLFRGTNIENDQTFGLFLFREWSF